MLYVLILDYRYLYLSLQDIRHKQIFILLFYSSTAFMQDFVSNIYQKTAQQLNSSIFCRRNP